MANQADNDKKLKIDTETVTTTTTRILAATDKQFWSIMMFVAFLKNDYYILTKGSFKK